MYGHRDAGFFGYSHFTGGFPGGQAEYVRVPKGNVNLLPVPESVSDEKALYLSDVLATSYHCVMDTGINEGDTVGIWVSVRWELVVACLTPILGFGPYRPVRCQVREVEGCEAHHRYRPRTGATRVCRSGDRRGAA